MPLSLRVMEVIPTRRHRTIRYEVTPAGVYAAGGDVVDFTLATNPFSKPMAFLSVPPAADQVKFLDSLAGADPEYVVGATLALGKVKLWSSAGNDHAAGVYTAAELADKLYMEVTVPIGK